MGLGFASIIKMFPAVHISLNVMLSERDKFKLWGDGSMEAAVSTEKK